MLTTQQKFERYGDPLDWGELVRAQCPYPMVIAWDTDYTIHSFYCNRKIVGNIEAALSCLLDHYGYDQIQELGLDQFGGCHEDRRMRGGSKWSSHAWGIAIDLHPKKNGLRTKAPKAAFSGAKYDALHSIMEEHNFINYGKLKGYDWMHFEIKE